MTLTRLFTLTGALAAFLVIAALPAKAANPGVQLGTLTCNVEGGIGFVFGSSKKMTCEFGPVDSGSEAETYEGRITKFGVDLGFTGRTVIIWAVIAAEPARFDPGQLRGTYAGATGEATFVAGLGANVLVGGSGKSVALQPVSVSASTGVNVAAGLAAIELK